VAFFASQAFDIPRSQAENAQNIEASRRQIFPEWAE
jgi:hypothetical protein